MSPDQRFTPPKAVVADVGDVRARSRGPAIVLGLFTVLQGLLTTTMLPSLLMLVEEGTMSPIGLAWLVLAELCLAVGVALLCWRAQRGRRTLLAAIVLFLFNRYAWRSAWMMGLLPIGAGVVIAAIGALLAWRRRPLMQAVDASRSPSP